MVSLVDSVLPLLAAPLRKATKAICDGCLILDMPPHKHPTSCGANVAKCPPKMALAQGFLAWGLTTAPEALLAPRLLVQVQTPLLVQHPQFDALQLGMLGAWPALFPSTRKYVESFGAAIRSLLQARQGGLFSFSAACSSGVENSLVSSNAFACRPVECMCQVWSGGARATLTTELL